MSRLHPSSTSSLARPTLSRPTLSRPASISEESSSSNNSHSDTMFPNTRIQIPSLLTGLNVPAILKGNGPANLRSPWLVNDAGLPPIPPFYPPLDPQCTIHVVDATPSTVAVRIAECLQKRSISVEFDDEMNTATCMTVDRVHFTVQLYRGDRTPPPEHTNDTESPPDLSHAVIVECVRTRGNPISFHPHCRAILKSATGLSDGLDQRQPCRTSPQEFVRLKRKHAHENILAPPAKRLATSTQSAILSVERSLALLKKDRLGAQRLGMEGIVMLTDERCAGVQTAIFTALAILGAPVTADLPKDNDECLQQLHEWIMSLLQDRVTPNEEEILEDVVACTKSRSCTNSIFDDSTFETSMLESTCVSPEDAHHGNIMRSLALRAFSNALSVLAREQGKLLKSILLVQSPHVVGQPVLKALIEDLSGATRPPTAVIGTRLASQHEAALAALCIGILADHSDICKLNLCQNKQLSVLENLKKARDGNRHFVLTKEAGRAHAVISRA